MKKTAFAIILAALLLLLASCSGEVKAPDDSWENIFLQYWNAMNNEYVHFSDDSSFDWDKVYEEYLPKFQALDYTNKEDSLTAFRYFKEIAVNVHDNHYNLKVTDGFGQSLSCSPAVLQKYKAAGGDIMDFPDITLVGNHGVPYPTSITDSGTYYDRSDKLKYYRKAIPSITEVSDLGEEKDEDDVTVIKKSYFHSPTGNIADEFGSAWCECSFESVSDEDKAKLDKEDAEIAEAWNTIVSTLGMSSCFFGVNSSNIFYIYISDFGSPYFLSDILTKDDAKLTKEEKEELKNTDSLNKLRNLVQNIMLLSTTISDTKLEKTVSEGIEGLKNLPVMYETLLSVTGTNSCTINGVSKSGIEGVIVDLRCNGGGAVVFLEAIWGAFFSSETKFGNVRYKSGYSRLEYTPWTSFSIEKDFVNKALAEKGSNYSNPVAVLVNGYSVSCSEISCVISKLLPDSAIIGQTTFGGTCGLTDRKIYNSGPFVSEHLSVYTTTFQFVDNDMKSWEITGIEPDIRTELSSTKDDAYIKAVEWVKSR